MAKTLKQMMENEKPKVVAEARAKSDEILRDIQSGEEPGMTTGEAAKGDLKWQFNRVVLVRSTNPESIEILRSQTENPSEVVQLVEFYGFCAYFDIPRPTKETGRILSDNYDILDTQEGVEYLHCSALAAWMDLEKFLKEGFAFREEEKKGIAGL